MTTIEPPRVPADSLRNAARAVMRATPQANVTRLMLTLRCGYHRAELLLKEEASL